MKRTQINIVAYKVINNKFVEIRRKREMKLFTNLFDKCKETKLLYVYTIVKKEIVKDKFNNI